MHGEKCIETRFGGHRVPTTREELDEVVANGSDVIAVQIDKRHVADGDDLSVARLEILAIDDGVIHLGFNLTHGWVVWLTLVVWQRLGGIATPCGQFGDCHTESQSSSRSG